MFDSLKSKMKSLFSRAEKKIDEKQVYKDEKETKPEAPAIEAPTTTQTTAPEAPKIETPEIPEIEIPDTPKAPEPEKPKPAEAVTTVEPVTVPEKTVPEEPKPEKVSRKEFLKRRKQEKVEHKAEAAVSSGLFDKKIKEDPLDEVLDELELILLEADVAYPVAEEIKKGVRENLVGKKYDRSYTLDQVVELAVKDAVRDVLKINEFDFDDWLEGRERPVVIMFVGINGTGKTTAIAKLANRVQKKEKTVVLAACDTFRAGAIEQLSIHAEKLGCKIVKQAHDADPAAVAYDAIEHARSKRKDVVFIDTAGRMQTNNNLIEEMKKIVRVAKPDLIIFVGDSLAGNDAIEQAKVFDAAVGIDAVILTKIDTDAKGGAALSIAHTIGKPIAFVCNGQEYDDIVKFNTDWMIDRMFE
ncbi:MAG: signal recognition particle-docking protein FtsY [Candidatus Methanomethylophilaceae archaeon]|nr:signal recognition particle-docking protein FtsY [Candidatus Methanomethylophilaceae archaeon]